MVHTRGGSDSGAASLMALAVRKLSVLGITALLLSQSICNFLNDIFERKGTAAEGIELCVTLSL